MNGLTNEQLRDKSAAIFARRPSKRVSEKYGFIPTVDLVKSMRDAGFVATAARGQRSYKGGDNHVYGRHMVAFQPAGPQSRIVVGDVVPTVTVYNSHNGRTLYKLIAGLFRLVCSNGLLVAHNNFGSIEVRHNEDALDEVTKASERIIAAAREATKTVAQMRVLKVDERQQLDFARHALKLRYADTPPIKADMLLVTRRDEDKGNDLWRVFNRVQENLIRGGMQGAASTGRRLTVRPFTNIRREIGVNLDLWGMTMNWMARHGATPRLLKGN